MPNHVTTICTVTGSDADVARFAEAHITAREGGPPSFGLGTVVPMPKCVQDTIFPMFGAPHPPDAPKGSVGDGQIATLARDAGER